MGAGVVVEHRRRGAMHAERDDLHQQRPLPEHRATNVGSRRVDGRLLESRRRRTSSRAAIATLAGGQLAPIQPPNDGFFEAVTFIGAVPPAPADNWMDGWTSFPQR